MSFSEERKHCQVQELFTTGQCQQTFDSCALYPRHFEGKRLNSVKLKGFWLIAAFAKLS